ncbi:MAG: T9SS type A sorting domain-containing protein [Candidatus Marinimicrobia bacterium]|nr:T9SS type A sorting domain-containing protein [Candidatus Neomarinimicrobiota bacterium]
MFRLTIALTSILHILTLLTNLHAQDIIQDYDGNEYHSVIIGNQVWLKENLKSLHYADGTLIPDVAVYNNSDRNANVYGRLYTWDAAMRGSTDEGAQGLCPDGWHIPSDAEWKELENYLGGAAIAGGKMKEAGTSHWNTPNTGADNSSGFTALPGGEYDAFYQPYSFQLLNEYAVFWTSTETSTDQARERYLAFNSAASAIYDWYKSMKYSIRAVKDQVQTDLKTYNEAQPESGILHPNFPNPFNPNTVIPFQVSSKNRLTIRIYDNKGGYVATLLDREMNKGYNEIVWTGTNDQGVAMSSGMYLVVLDSPDKSYCRKITLLR